MIFHGKLKICNFFGSRVSFLDICNVSDPGVDSIKHFSLTGFSLPKAQFTLLLLYEMSILICLMFQYEHDDQTSHMDGDHAKGIQAIF